MIKGRYCIIDRIGQGGQGTLYLARDLDLGIYRAVKELPADRKKEAGFLRLLEHPSLPRMIDYTEDEECCYLVMEYLQGKSLSQLQKEGKEFTAEEILKIAEVILDIYRYLHSCRPPVFYGDLKPENLMRTEGGALYLVDFGSAVFGYERQFFFCMGTRGYAAPEQYQGQISAASDLFALGKTLEVLCGKKKWRWFLKYPGLFYLIRKCCQYQPEKRWKNAEEALCYLKHLHPLPHKLAGVLVLGGGILAPAVLALGLLSGNQTEKLPFSNALSYLTSGYYSMDFRSGSCGMREQILDRIGVEGERLRYYYREKEEQRSILYLLAANSELQGKAVRAENYYRELLAKKESSTGEYCAYGMFLLRQGKGEESRKLYQLWKKQKKDGGEEKDSRDLWEWRRALMNQRLQKEKKESAESVP